MKDNETHEQLRQQIQRLEGQSEEYRRLEEAHREGKRRLTTLISNLPGIVYRCANNRDWTMEFISDGCLQLTGYSAGELVGSAILSYNEIIHADDREMVWSRIQEALAQGESYTLTYRINCRDGREKWVWEQGVGVFSSPGELVALEGFITDITEQKNNEAALRREMDFIDTLLQAAPAFFVAIDYDGKVLMMNQAMLKALGYTAEEVIGRDYLQTFVPKSARAMLAEVFKTLTRPGGVTLHKNRMSTRNGEELILEWHGRAVADSEGKFRFFFGVGSDVTERERAEQQRGEHLHFLSCLERIDRVIRKSTGLEEMMSEVLGEVLEIFNCDRIWLLYPCNPEAESFRVPMERTRPEYPGALERDVDVRMTPGMAAYCREALNTEEPVAYTNGTGRPVAIETTSQFSVQSMMFMAVDPKISRPWVFGIHHCSYARLWTENETQLFKAIGQRVGDGLRSMLAFRDLAASEHKMRSTLVSMDDLVFTLDSDGVFLDYYQQTNYEALYIPPDQYLGKSYKEVLPAEVANLIERAIKEIAESGISQSIEYSLDIAGGTRWFSTRMSGRHDAAGRFDGVTAVARDITLRKRAEESLRAREAFLSAIFRAAPTGIGVVVDRVIKEVNQRLCEMTGYAALELKKHNARMLYPDDAEYEWVGEEKYRQINEKGTGTVQTRWRRKNGEIIDVLLSSTPLNPEDLSEGVTFTALDITQRVTSERELRRSEERYRQLIETMNEGLAMADADGRITFVNQRLCDMLGYSEADLVGRKTSDFFDSENQEILENQQSRRLTGERAIYEIVWTRKDGSRLASIISPREILDDNGEYRGSFAVITDITEHKRLEEQFNHAQRLETVGRLAAGIAHDFNNMLSPILCYAELVLADMPPADSHCDQVREIQKAAERSRDLTQRLLAFSRKQVLELKPLNLSDMVMGLEKMLRGTLREDIEIKFFLDPDAGNIRGDTSQIEQVLMNLAVNAQHAMPTAGVLGIEVAGVEVDKILAGEHSHLPPGRYVQLAVSDTGVGMDEETARHVFEPFFTTRETGKGTGLGLATVYGIVKQHGGHIQVRSEVNRGTEFRIYFPLTTEPVKKPKPGQPLRSPAVCNETIMVAEDEYMLRDLVCTVLNSQGYTVISAAGGYDCLRVAQEHDGPVHLLLTDVIMPGLNGKELYERMAAIVPGLKVMYFSGYAADIIANHGVLDEGINFLKKPFSVAALTGKVREVLDS